MYTIEVKDYWNDGHIWVIDVELTDAQVLELTALCEPEYLRKHVHDGVVGKCTSAPSDGKLYFAPCLEMCGFKLSLQVNYYVWSLRHDRGTDQHALITEEEFGAVLPSVNTWLDVQIMYDGKELTTCQMTLAMVADSFRRLLDTGWMEL